MEHVEAVAALEDHGVEGMIIGRALYEGTLTRSDALAAVQRRD
jgi:phosphoribosylformimino-5-aminoimidazole carboxamide ribonucleotide (ProFAR) isomerase